MKLSRPLALICALLAAPVCKAQTPSKTSTPKSLENSTLSLPFADARRMTVLVRIKHSFESLGSAVWIGKTGYLATCYHVVKNVQLPLVVGMPHDPIFATGQWNLAISGVVDTVDVVVVAWDESTDIAILKAARPPGQTQSPLLTGSPIGASETLWTSKGATLATRPPKPGETVLLAGYPLKQTTLILQTGIATGQGAFSRPQAPASAPANSRRIMLSLVSNPGNSGGPVFDYDGNVVGILEGNLLSPMHDADGKQILSCLRAKLDPAGNPLRDQAGNPRLESTPCVQNSGISIAVPAQFITDLAKKNNIDLQ